MKHFFTTLSVALATTLPLAATAGSVTIDFEKTWNFAQGAVNGYYGGGKAQDGTSGPNLGVNFTNVSGLSNDALGPYYANAPTGLGTAYVFDSGAFVNYTGYTGGFNNFALFYSNPDTQSYTIDAYSGLNGSGVKLGTLTLMQNDNNNNGIDDVFTRGQALFASGARSFDLSSLAGSNVIIDQITVIPEPGVALLMMTGASIALIGRRKSRK